MMKKVLHHSLVSRFRSSKGSALIETALTVLLLMLLVIGIGAINVQISAMENAGRGLQELGHTSVEMIVEDNEITPANEEILLEMIRARTKAPKEDVLVNIKHIRRSAFTGEYVIMNEYDLGWLAREEIVSVQSTPSPNPGIHMLGERIELDLGEEVLVMYFATVYRGVPRGIRAPEVYEQVLVMPFLN